jgi:CheY-like chemotaxis protein/anti-sigma regulatory factor (Ser/Thr protein kinase)
MLKPRPLAMAGERSSALPFSTDNLALSAHEIRNPAQALLGLTDMLMMMALPPDAQACAKVIRQSAQAILAVVDDALDLARLQQGFIEFVAEPFDPRALLTGCVEILHQQAAAKGLDLAGLVDPALPARVIGDAGRLRQILLNLAGNAIKFTETGGVGLALRLGADGALLFVIEDTGPGISEGERAALFDAFSTTGHELGGLGLGLAVSAGIANALGGTLSVEARETGGTRFCLTLHCPALPETQAPAMSANPKRPILIVSAAPFTGPYLAEKLIGLGHETELIERPERAGLWLADHPDAVMLVDAALGARGLNVALHRARAVGCQSIALLRSLDEAQSLDAMARYAAWPIIRKPVTGHAAALRLEAIGRHSSNKASEADRSERGLALIVDDCPVNRLLAVRLLQQQGYRTLEAQDGFAAIDYVAEHLARDEEPLALIIIDLAMPGLDGRMVARQIRGVEALFQAPPALIIGASAYVDPQIKAAAQAEGMDDVVSKPLTPALIAGFHD